jgi:hypothetical protein
VPFVTVPKVHDSDPKIEQRAARETVLVAQMGKLSEDNILIDRALLRRQSGEPIVRRVVAVEEEASDDAIPGRDVDLRLDQIAFAPELIAVRIAGQPRDDDVVVRGLESVEEPRFVSGDRTQKTHTRHEFVEVQPSVNFAVRTKEGRWR